MYVCFLASDLMHLVLSFSVLIPIRMTLLLSPGLGQHRFILDFMASGGCLGKNTSCQKFLEHLSTYPEFFGWEFVQQNKIFIFLRGFEPAWWSGFWLDTMIYAKIFFVGTFLWIHCDHDYNYAVASKWRLRISQLMQNFKPINFLLNVIL